MKKLPRVLKLQCRPIGGLYIGLSTEMRLTMNSRRLSCGGG